MSGSPASPAPRTRRPDLVPLAFAVPAIAGGYLGGAPAWVLLVPAFAALAVAVLPLLGGRLDRRTRFAPFAIALVGAAVPLAVVPSDPVTAVLGAATGVGFLVWFASTSSAPAGPGRRIAAVAAPALATFAALSVALATPALSAGPGVAALLLVGALFLISIPLARGWASDEPPRAEFVGADDGPAV